MRNALATVALAVLVPSAFAVDFTVDPRGSYILASGETPPGATVIDLAANGFAAGDEVTLTRLGGFQYASGSDPLYNLFGVFSSSTELLGVDQLHRVVSAIDAGLDAFTLNTFNGDLSTDIAEDFRIADATDTFHTITIVIPTGAAYLFVAGNDTYYTDNVSLDYGLRMEQTDAVPEPATMAVVGAGLLTFARRRRRA